MKIFPLKPMSRLDHMEVLMKLMTNTPIKQPYSQPQTVISKTKKAGSTMALTTFFKNMKIKGKNICSKLLR